MRILKTIVILLLFFAFKQGNAQALDSLNASPNPFTSTVTITFGLAKDDTVSLGLYNRWGDEIKSFIRDSIMDSGDYTITYNGDSLPEENYYLILQFFSHKAKTKIITKKSNLTSISYIDNLRTNLKLTPNPATIFLTIPFTGLKNIIVSDLNGRACLSLTTDKEIISLVDLKTGIYTVRIISVDNVLLVTEKIVKIE